MRFELPSICAESIENGAVDIGLVPVIEAFRQNLELASDVCISSDGPVRSIFLVHRKPIQQIRSVALDSSSKTSVALTRIVLAERYGLRPAEHRAAPDVISMLETADAALLIGDPALRLQQDGPFQVLDLGLEWKILTGLPMVYAVWAGKAGMIPAGAEATFRASYEWGKTHLGEIVRTEAAKRGVGRGDALEYLSKHILYELDGTARRGMHEFQRLAAIHGAIGPFHEGNLDLGVKSGIG